MHGGAKKRTPLPLCRSGIKNVPPRAAHLNISPQKGRNISLKIEDGIIKDVKFKTFGCGAAIATSSMATEMIKGKPLDEALKLTNQAVVEALDGLPAVKIHCSVLAEQAVKAAISDYYTRQGIDPLPIVGPIGEVECAE